MALGYLEKMLAAPSVERDTSKTSQGVSNVDIGFIGLGAMGSAIATNLVTKSGYAITVWKRTAAKAESLVAAGAKLAKTPKEAGAGKSIVFSMLADDSALHAALSGDDGLLTGLPKGALHVSLSTIAVATADHVAALHHERGQRYVSAPVFGRPDAAAAGRLFIAAAGAAADLDEADPVLAAIGQKYFRIGDKPSAANLVKLCGNFAILAAIETMAEAMALAEKGGVPIAKLLEVLTGTLFDAPVYRTYGSILVEDALPPPASRRARLEGHATGRRGRRQEPRGHATAEPGARPSAGDDRQGGRGHRQVRHRQDRRPQHRPLGPPAARRRVSARCPCRPRSAPECGPWSPAPGLRQRQSLRPSRAGRCRPGPATVNTRGRLWAARLINNPRRTKIGHVEAFPVLHMRSLRKSATSGRLRLFFLGGTGG